ncbi:Glycolate dehydrogenase, FAD-binding subunit GlcE [hydrothermal vent metagenome]|uniref:Glycolate dehydrogenase, FAD-binding subunit GlcE n=1 Tax=hydrothermal vent metagenome TaxID=652676 RepID=A0A3B0WCF9_9ZZZZ
MNNDISQNLAEQVSDAIGDKSSLVITSGNSKTFYGNRVKGEVISTAEHTGIIEYQPSELVVTVRSGTLLSELEAELKANKQMLAFEPPQHSANTTIGGIIACGLSGPRRAACGSARDFVLGTTIINGRAEKLKFGGQVMKNVAGYDASRLMVGAQGTLGILLNISLKVLPINEVEITLQLNIELNAVNKQIQQWVKQGLPVTASCFFKNTLYIRLGSTHSAVKKSLTIINSDFNTKEIDNNFWLTIKNQTHDFFTGSQNLWRCSHQNNTAFYENTEEQLLEWNGALRWINVSENSGDKNLHATAEKYNGHAQRYPLKNSMTNNKQITDIFQPLQPAALKIHKRLKQAFDPENILNPHRLYSDL